ncbi:cell division-specific peptidoglycan biosynthesis regulator FtsW [Austwickia chelonae]|uniref:Probable peptidoglycan glycosyltransferase FtsW n=1 Tax=Austwickia chelonae NBRC 105200 TaxID=1184607 RepID=K6VID4_9MICO|nr:cell division membrane protein FtsW [Austwickia chelonae NBRC 105200]SEW25427.1 cell division-specific peptidoglycan biosynthesis regulator FtsW [Austwickia chelonae]
MGVRRRIRPASRADAPGGSPDPRSTLSGLHSPLSTYYLLITSIGTLLGIGLFMVLSASSVMSLHENGNVFTIGLNQAKFALIGVVLAMVTSRVPISVWRSLGAPVLVGALLLQLLVFVPGLGVSANGNTNWLRLGGLQFQPSEFGKLGLILYAAWILTVKRHRLADWKHVVIPVIFPAATLLFGLVLGGGDLGTAIVLFGILFAVLWTSGIPSRILGVGVAGCTVLVLLLALLSANRMRRIAGWLSCEKATDHDGACWQAINGQFALADGGLWGLGPGASREKWGWLPERHNDFIFAIIGEELGIFGTFSILLLICMIMVACYRVILQSEDMFVRLATAGVMGWFVVQSVVNIGAVIGLLPVIGVPLPLVSAGGSAMVTTLFGLGMVVSFARNEPACQRALTERPHVLARSLSILSPLRKRRR